MSWVGTVIGRPVAGDRMLLADSMRTRASAWASADSGQVDGHLVAVEVGVEGGAHERVDLDGLALHQHRLERLDARGGAASGARFKSTGCSRMTPSSTSQTWGRRRSTMRLADLMFWASSVSTSRFMTKGLNSSSAISLGRPHWCSCRVGPITMTERPE